MTISRAHLPHGPGEDLETGFVVARLQFLFFVFTVSMNCLRVTLTTLFLLGSFELVV
ncbi:MAG: hypothetical protein ACR2HH_01585 [Chthoniobacterales bacterium]